MYLLCLGCCVRHSRLIIELRKIMDNLHIKYYISIYIKIIL
jgi:hypothetical protein